MMKMSESFGDSEHSSRRHRTQRKLFLEKMDKLVPRALLVDLASLTVRRAAGAARRARRRQFSGVAACSCSSTRATARPGTSCTTCRPPGGTDGLSHGRPMPDETTMSDFRRLPELHVFGEAIFNAIGRHLESKGFRLSKCRMVDATIVAAPSSTKNKDRARDPEMHSTQKGRQLYFGMKLRIGVNEETGLTHNLDRTPANKSDVGMAGALPPGGEERVSGDAGYQGAGSRPENEGLQIDWKIAMRGAGGRCLARTGRRRPRRGARRRCGPGSSIRSGG